MEVLQTEYFMWHSRINSYTSDETDFISPGTKHVDDHCVI